MERGQGNQNQHAQKKELRHLNVVSEETKTEKVEALGHNWNNDFTVDNEATL